MLSVPTRPVPKAAACICTRPLPVSTEGLPLGVLRAGFDAPQPGSDKNKPREQKKSFRWIEGLHDCARAARELPETRIVCTLNREADFVDLFVERREHAPQVELLVRAKVDRVLGKDTAPDGSKLSRRLFDDVRNSPARGDCIVEVTRLSARIKAGKQAEKPRRTARNAKTTLRYQRVALPCPGAAPVEMSLVHIREENPPRNVKPLEWFILTTLPVNNPDEARQILHWYALRWRIEDYFRVLKSGCKVEELQHNTALRLERAIAINMVIAWRVQLMVRPRTRKSPNCPPNSCSPMSSCVCSRPSRARATSRRRNVSARPSRWWPHLGGWFKRPDPPGAELMWQGYTQLAAMALAFEIRDEFG